VRARLDWKYALGVEQGVPAQVIGSPQHARTRTFLQRVLNPAAANLGEVPTPDPPPR
jgi:polar amino acid transport system ATP-binding protein